MCTHRPFLDHTAEISDTFTRKRDVQERRALFTASFCSRTYILNLYHDWLDYIPVR